MQDLEKTLDKIKTDIQTYELLRTYKLNLISDERQLPTRQNDTMILIEKRINENMDNVYAIYCSKSNDLPFILFKKIQNTLNLSARSSNVLSENNIIFIGDLVVMSESELLKYEAFGRKSLNEIKYELKELGLRLNMNYPNWRPYDFEVLVDKYEEC